MTDKFNAPVREFLRKTFLFRADDELDDNQSLLESGVIDSPACSKSSPFWSRRSAFHCGR